MLGMFNTWTSLWVGEPSRYVASHLGQLSFPFLQGRWIKYQLARLGEFTYVGWQV